MKAQAPKKRLPNGRKGRAVWMLKPREQSRRDFLKQVRAQFQKPLLSETAIEALKLKETGYDSVPATSAVSFLSRNKRTAIDSMVRILELARHSAEFTVTHLDEVRQKEPKLFKWVFVATIETILDKEERTAFQKAQDVAKRYFRARNIPVRTDFEREALEHTAFSYARKRNISELARPINLAEIESDYLKRRRDYRFLEHQYARETNTEYRMLFGSERFTRKQAKVAKAWVEKNRKRMSEERDVITARVRGQTRAYLTNEQLEDIRRLFREARARNRALAEEQVLHTFRQAQKKAQRATTGTQPIVTKKFGSRAERLAAYVPGEKTKNQRISEIAEEQQKASLSGTAFNAENFVFLEIRKQSPLTAEIMLGLLGKGILSHDNYMGLFTTGALARRIFVTTLTGTDFQARFGTKTINLLARGIVYIGPAGKQIERAKRVFQGTEGKKVYEFLVQRGMLDEKHGGGTVVRLARI